jgi:hypothetical protein
MHKTAQKRVSTAEISSFGMSIPTSAHRAVGSMSVRRCRKPASPFCSTILTIYEAGNSVPYTGKLESLAKHQVTSIIDKTLKDDARKYFDIEAHAQFRRTPLRAAPTGGNSTTSVAVSSNGSTAITNNVALSTGHVKAISDYMKEANIPAYRVMTTSLSLIRPRSARSRTRSKPSRSTPMWALGTSSRAKSAATRTSRFIEQNSMPKGGANDSTTFDPYGQTADGWNNGLSSWAYFFGGDTVTEAVAIPEEIRAKIPGDFGRSKGIAWYYLGGFALVHDDAANARVVMWDSAA